MRALAPLVAAAVALTVSVDGSGLAQCPGRPRHEAAETTKDLTVAQTINRCRAYDSFPITWAVTA
jgi:hypothetical protein